MTKQEINKTFDYSKQEWVKWLLKRGPKKLAKKGSRIIEDPKEQRLKKIHQLQVQIEKEGLKQNKKLLFVPRKDTSKSCIQDLYVEMLNEKLSYLENIF